MHLEYFGHLLAFAPSLAARGTRRARAYLLIAVVPLAIGALGLLLCFVSLEVGLWLLFPAAALGLPLLMFSFVALGEIVFRVLRNRTSNAIALTVASLSTLAVIAAAIFIPVYTSNGLLTFDKQTPVLDVIGSNRPLLVGGEHYTGPEMTEALRSAMASAAPAAAVTDLVHTLAAVRSGDRSALKLSIEDMMEQEGVPSGRSEVTVRRRELVEFGELPPQLRSVLSEPTYDSGPVGLGQRREPSYAHYPYRIYDVAFDVGVVYQAWAASLPNGEVLVGITPARTPKR